MDLARGASAVSLPSDMFAIARHWHSVAVLAPFLLAAAPDAGAQGAVPCAPGTAAPPSVSAEDREAGPGGTLTATHSIDIDATFSDGSSPSDLQISAPPGVIVRGTTFVSDVAGPVPVTLTWTLFPPDGDECTASSTTTFDLQSPAPLKFGKPPRALRPKFARHSAGWVLRAMVGRYTDLRPIELRFRGHARARLPSPSRPFKTATVPLRSVEPGLGRQRYLRSPSWQVTAHITFQKPTFFFLEARVKTGSTHDHPVGYELQALQGGRLLIRVREAGKCNLGGCTFRTVKVQRGT
jgi:hypothetical protein